MTSSYGAPAHERAAGANRLFSFFTDLKIGAKIASGFALVLLLLAGMATFAVLGVVEVDHDFAGYGDISTDAVALNDLDAETMTMAWQAGEYVLTFDEDTLKQAQDLQETGRAAGRERGGQEGMILVVCGK